MPLTQLLTRFTRTPTPIPLREIRVAPKSLYVVTLHVDYQTIRWIFVLTDEWGIPTPVYSGWPTAGGNNCADAVVLGQFRITGCRAAPNGLDELAWTCAGATMSFLLGPLWVANVLHTLYESGLILDPRSQAKQSRTQVAARVKGITDYIASRTAERTYIYRTTGVFLVSSEDV